MSVPAVQRWRIVYRRLGAAAALTGRDSTAPWEVALLGCGLPVVTTEGDEPRPRLTFGPPVGPWVITDEELLDLLLSRRCTKREVMDGLAAGRPPDHEVLDVYDVWVGAPSLPASIVAGVYRVELVGDADMTSCAALVDDVLAASSLERSRERGGRTTTYDLRPLIGGIDLDPAGPALVMRLRIDQQLGLGRPEEVMAELAARADPGIAASLRPTRMVRERLVLSDG